MIRIGHTVDILREIPDHSVHCVVTSPPYYGLRDYDLEPVVWDPVRYIPMTGLPPLSVPPTASGNATGCPHEWDTWQESHEVRESPVTGKSRTTDRFYGDPSRRFDGNHQKHAHGQYCRLCGSWRGCLGLEPSIDLYVGHLVEVFREVRRVLRKDGTLWLNLGDSYSNGGRKTRDSDKKLHARSMATRPENGAKPKDLLGMPWRVALALQADGWTLRSDIVWAKPNAMPESVRDRPTRSHEMVFLFSSSERYFYDRHAIMEKAVQESCGKAASFKRNAGNKRDQVIPGQSKGTHRPDRPDIVYNLPLRNRRDVWTLSTKPYRGAHFAVMPPDLVKPCILAGTSEAGCCPHCGTPWTRDADTWKSTCSCPAHSPIPCTVLDPFGGSGTIAMVAKKLGRTWEIIEANHGYGEIIKTRVNING
jgi:DNA modification methylase